jgi:hypothetical protein
VLTGKRLADLRTMFSDPSFGEELEKTLRSALRRSAAKTLAELLSPAFDPEPRRRPVEVRAWAEQVAAELLR